MEIRKMAIEICLIGVALVFTIKVLLGHAPLEIVAHGEIVNDENTGNVAGTNR